SLELGVVHEAEQRPRRCGRGLPLRGRSVPTERLPVEDASRCLSRRLPNLHRLQRVDREVARDPWRRWIRTPTISSVPGPGSVGPRHVFTTDGNDRRSYPGRTGPSRVGGPVPAPARSARPDTGCSARLDPPPLPGLVDPSPSQL